MKLTAAQVRDIKRQLAEGISIPKVATAFGVSVSMIYSIKQGRRWASVA